MEKNFLRIGLVMASVMAGIFLQAYNLGALGWANKDKEKN